MKSKDEKIIAVEDALGAPADCELSENTLKIRRNVLVTSFASIATVLADVTINPNSTILGLQFSGLTEDLIRKGLLVLLIYLLFHFLWCLHDSFLTWRVRVTGTRLMYVTTGKFSNESSDYPDDSRQSSLYWWWLSEARKIGNIGAKITAVEASIKEWEDRVNELIIANPTERQNLTNDLMQINRVQGDLQSIKAGVQSAESALSSDRIPVSLSRFDDVFGLLLRSQNLRWLVVEAGMPLLIGGYALILLAHSVSL